jgi:hypothetical protein
MPGSPLSLAVERSRYITDLDAYGQRTSPPAPRHTANDPRNQQIREDHEDDDEDAQEHVRMVLLRRDDARLSRSGPPWRRSSDLPGTTPLL